MLFQACTLLAVACSGAAAQNRIAQSIPANGPRVAIASQVNARAQAATDVGPLPATTRLEAVTLHFSLSAAQNEALNQLLADQQNPASPRYRQWLTPESYAAQFGLTDGDLTRVTAWLGAQGLAVEAVARGKSFVTISGTAEQVNRAFGVTLHRLSFNGEQHFANLTEPSLPASLAAVTSSITGLDDFKLKPRIRSRRVLAPRYTAAATGSHYLAPGDLYTIYDINPLLASSVNGSGVTIAIMGQTDLSLADVATFRSVSGLAANAPTVKLYGSDPGTSRADLTEAMLDVEWSGAIAPSATILYVNSTDVFDGSLTNAIDDNVAPILAISYGDCEQNFGAATIAAYSQLFRQANAQGQTVVGPSGDSGATDCDYEVTIATNGFAVDFPASAPNVTGVGGTMFNEGSGTYFGAGNGNYQGSALSYIPETVWNETAVYGSLAGSGGGVSAYFSKPAYQAGPGVPNDFSRDVPDLALDAAVEHDGTLICVPGDCVNGYADATGHFDVIGGTSVSTPEFAGMLALVEQKIQARIGNANPTLYGLANSAYAGAVFHDVTTGNNAMPCRAGTTACPAGGSIGYSAAPGYDLATGWGSVDAYNMVSSWLLVTPAGQGSTTGSNASATTLTDTTSTVAPGGSITFKATVASATTSVNSSPTGTVQFLVDNVPSGSAVAISNGTATYALVTTGLAAGAHTVSASYSGDAAYAGSKSSVAIAILSTTSADFTLTPLSATVTASSGTNAPGVTYTVAPLNGFTGVVAFRASTTSTTLSSTSNAIFSPPQVTIASSASGTTILTLSAFVPSARGANTFTQASAASSDAPGNSNSPGNTYTLAGSFAGLACLVFSVRRRRFAGLLAALVCLCILTLAGCASAPATPTGTTTVNTPAGTYTVLVTATGTTSSGAVVSHNATLTLVVQ